MSDETIDLPSILRREQQAWASLYDSWVHGTFGLIWHLTGGDRVICEDLNQDTWLAAINSIEDFNPQRGNLKSWVFGIARNKANQHLRHAYRNGTAEHDSFATETASTCASAEPPLTVLETNERAALIQAALATLSPERRDVLRCKYVEGQSVKQIAERFGKTPKAVESMLSRARADLRDLLQCYFNGHSANSRTRT